MWALSRDAARAVRFVDVNPVYTDHATGNALAGYQFSDGLHDSPAGGLAKARLLATALDDLFPREADLLISSVADSYHAALNPGGDMLTNGLMTGSGGALVNGAAGSVPAGWTGGLAASGGSSLTVSIGPGSDPDYPAVPMACLTLGGVGDSNFAKLDQNIASPAGLSAGDRISLRAGVRWSGLAGVKAIGLRLSLSDGMTVYEAWDAAPFNPSGTVPMIWPPQFAGLMKTPTITLPANFQGLRAWLQVMPMAGATVSGIVAFGRCSMRRA